MNSGLDMTRLSETAVVQPLERLLAAKWLDNQLPSNKCVVIESFVLEP